MPKQTKKTTLKVKDLAPKKGASKHVKGGGVAPCFGKRN